VFENVAFGLRGRGVGGNEIARRVTAALARVGLDGVEARRPPQLSAGQGERVALARALVVGPRLLLLDEPLAALTGPLRVQLRQELARLHRDVGITTMYATRDPSDALSLATRIAVIDRGALVQEGKPDEIYWRPRSRIAAELVGAANLVAVRVIEIRELGVLVETAGGARLPAPAGGRIWSLGERALLCLRPEALRLEEAELAPGGIPGTVATYAFEGGRQLYEVAIAGGGLRVDTPTSAALGRAFRPGDRVKVEIPPETAVLLPETAPAPPG
ncbi:MAG: ABC transporter ATP-binding protein, partial [Candidatus Rokubacteria bacterium]|nr:ABC transporter ATP-binding protein [Candidatus Rokubacteria bacterium]